MPTAQGVRYEGPLTATGRSGARQVEDATAIRTTIEQNSSAVLEVEQTESRNLRDGRYQLSGAIEVRNNGDQNLRELAMRINVMNGPTAAQEPFDVVFESIEGPESCSVAGLPANAVPSALVALGSNLNAGDACRIEYSVIARPGARLDDWRIVALATAVTPRGAQLELNEADPFDLEESPEVRASVSAFSLVNVNNGNYVLEVDTTLENTGDTPLIDAEATFDTSIFGDLLLSQERLINTCSVVDWPAPLAAAQPVESCFARDQLVIAPGAELDGWVLDARVTGTSTSGLSVVADERSDEIVFEEAPALESEISLVAIEKVNDESIRVRLNGELRNTGDVELRRVSNALRLREIFDDAPVTIEGLGVNGLTLSENFDGVTFAEMFTRDDVLAAGAEAQWDMTVAVATGADAGPFEIAADARGISPATEVVEVSTSTIARAVPIIEISGRSFTPTNNNDGTYSIEHVVEICLLYTSPSPRDRG